MEELRGGDLELVCGRGMVAEDDVGRIVGSAGKE